MERPYPIFTAEAKCQDCYKCLRQCPVKAIQVRDGRARVSPAACVVCGSCVNVCPAHAKRIRNDLNRAKQLVSLELPVYVSLAPSWVGEFAGVDAGRMVGALQQLGFSGVGETALGAQEVSATVARALTEQTPGIHVSSACPAAVSFIRKYLPEHTTAITQLYSPLLAHARLLRATFGNDIRVVFIGPCIAKKTEADDHPELVDIALTFDDLRQWFEHAGIDPACVDVKTSAHAFVPQDAQEGALYPIEGGMINAIRALGDFGHVRFVGVSGIENIRAALWGWAANGSTAPVFIEALACAGGCVGGPCAGSPGALLGKRLAVEQRTELPNHPVHREPRAAIGLRIEPLPIDRAEPSSAQLREALLGIGKKSVEDELNCSGCGYNTCREFAAAMVRGHAEPAMCVSYMRKLAHNKANALLRAMPSGVVIVDSELRIVECNERFARMFGEQVSLVYDACPGLKNCALEKVLPFTSLFTDVLLTDEELHFDHYRFDGRLLNITVFTLEPHQVVGAVMLDVSNREYQRDQISRQAKEVIRRNLSTVQEIAYKLGEHMADTEILLRSIAEGYTTDDGRAAPVLPDDGVRQ
ncbi:MAG: PAS domain-containing protein [Spirochaetaceae bacterium]|nr:MAG: PAS domain-containing protein [Spirochaetaceae bacterium]